MTRTDSIKKFVLGPLIFILMVNMVSIAQNESPAEKKLRNKAVKSVQNKRYANALPQFQKLYESNPSNLEYNYYLGFIYLNTATDKSIAIPYLQKAYERKDDWPYVIGELAQAHHLVYNFDTAINLYEEYKDRLVSAKLRSEVDHSIQKCHNAKLLVQDTVDARITNLGKGINTIYPDYAPIISSDDGLLVFTSRRPTTTGGKRDADQLYFEDIYVSLKKKGEWMAPTGIGDKVNTDLHDASIGLSADAQQMYMYHGENIYVTKLKGTEWSVPRKVGSNINTKSWETHASISLDQQVLYFTSDRKGGYGGMDIYMALKLPSGRWGLVQNLGPEINTPYDEKAPFIHPADKTLYFSSKGHYNMGGFDIFKSSFINNEWTTPQNMGHPINTPGDDLFFVVSANGKHTYFASDLRKDNIGGQDIYQLTYPDTGMVKIAVIRGKVYGAEQKPLAVTFTVLDQETSKVMGVYNSNASTGNYLLVLPTGKDYDMVIKANGFTPHKESFTIPEQEYAYYMSQEIGLTHLSKDDSILGQKIIFRNSFYDIEMALTADVSLNTNDSEAASRSKFIRNLENPDIRELVLAEVQNFEERVQQNIFTGISAYQPLSQIHMFHEANMAELEATLIEFENDTVVLNRDTIFREKTIYATSSSSYTKVDLATLDHTIHIELEPFEQKIISSHTLATNPEPPTEVLQIGMANITKPIRTLIQKSFQNILFGFDGTSLQKGSLSNLDNLVAQMKTNKFTTAYVNGHTDHIGTIEYNNMLSLRRANAVADYIISKGISGKRMVVNGYGEARPIAANAFPNGVDNPLGRKKNRRTEVGLVDSLDEVESLSFTEPTLIIASPFQKSRGYDRK